MDFPDISELARLARLEPPGGQARVVMDTDTYNEIDDQFAVVHALLSPEKLLVEALYATPFRNNRSSGPADGMEKSYQEIQRLLARLEVAPEGGAFRGSKGYLRDWDHPQQSPAAEDLVQRAMATGDEPLYRFVREHARLVDDYTSERNLDLSFWSEGMIRLRCPNSGCGPF